MEKQNPTHGGNCFAQSVDSKGFQCGAKLASLTVLHSKTQPILSQRLHQNLSRIDSFHGQDWKQDPLPPNRKLQNRTWKDTDRNFNYKNSTGSTCVCTRF